MKQEMLEKGFQNLGELKQPAHFNHSSLPKHWCEVYIDILLNE